MSPMKLEVNEDIIKKQLLINDEKDELETLFPTESLLSAAGTMIKPVPGMCVKTKDNTTQQKAFVNVCTSDSVPAPEDISNDELLAILDSDEPSDFRIPMSIGQPHEEKDKSGNPCFTYDVVINSKFFEKLKDNPLFENFFMIITIESLGEKHKVELDKNSWVVLRNKKYHGSIQEQRVRTPLPLIQELSGVKKWTPEDFPSDSRRGENFKEETPRAESSTEPLLKEIKTTRLEEAQNGKKKPKFSMIPSDSGDGSLRAEISLPAVVSADKIIVDVGEDRVVIETEEYFLDQILPFSLDGHLSKAYFITNIRVLVLILAQNNK